MGATGAMGATCVQIHDAALFDVGACSVREAVQRSPHLLLVRLLLRLHHAMGCCSHGRSRSRSIIVQARTVVSLRPWRGVDACVLQMSAHHIISCAPHHAQVLHDDVVQVSQIEGGAQRFQPDEVVRHQIGQVLILDVSVVHQPLRSHAWERCEECCPRNRGTGPTAVDTYTSHPLEGRLTSAMFRKAPASMSATEKSVGTKESPAAWEGDGAWRVRRRSA